MQYLLALWTQERSAYLSPSSTFRYILDGLEEQLKQKKKLSPIVPIIIYQGKKRWKIRDLSTYFGKSIPESLLRYLPRFDYHLTHVNALSDEVILALGKSLLG